MNKEIPPPNAMQLRHLKIMANYGHQKNNPIKKQMTRKEKIALLHKRQAHMIEIRKTMKDTKLIRKGSKQYKEKLKKGDLLAVLSIFDIKNMEVG